MTAWLMAASLALLQRVFMTACGSSAMPAILIALWTNGTLPAFRNASHPTAPRNMWRYLIFFCGLHIMTWQIGGQQAVAWSTWTGACA